MLIICTQAPSFPNKFILSICILRMQMKLKCVYRKIQDNVIKNLIYTIFNNSRFGQRGAKLFPMITDSGEN